MAVREFTGDLDPVQPAAPAPTVREFTGALDGEAPGLLDRVKQAVGWRSGEQFTAPPEVTDATFSAGVPEAPTVLPAPAPQPVGKPVQLPGSVMDGYVPPAVDPIARHGSFAAASQAARQDADETARLVAEANRPTLKAPPLRNSAADVAAGLVTGLKTDIGKVGGTLARGAGKYLAEEALGNAPLRQAGQTLEQSGKDVWERYAREEARHQPEFETTLGRGLYGGARSLEQMLAALVVAGGNPQGTLAAMVGPLAVTETGNALAAGKDLSTSIAYGLGQGGLEYMTEKLPLGFLMQNLGRGGLKQLIGGYLLREMPSEQVATLTQDALQKATLEPEKTWAQYWAERPEAALETAIATGVMTGGVGALHGAARGAQRLEARQADLAAQQAAEAARAQALQAWQTRGLTSGTTAPQEQQRAQATARHRADLATALADDRPMADIIAEQQAQTLEQQGWPALNTPAVATLPDGSAVPGTITNLMDADGVPVAEFQADDGATYRLQPGDAQITTPEQAQAAHADLSTALDDLGAIFSEGVQNAVPEQGAAALYVQPAPADGQGNGQQDTQPEGPAGAEGAAGQGGASTDAVPVEVNGIPTPPAPHAQVAQTGTAAASRELPGGRDVLVPVGPVDTAGGGTRPEMAASGMRPPAPPGATGAQGVGKRDRGSPIMRRNDLVGAIMRVTGGRGIAANMAMTIAGDTANRTSKVSGLFTKDGWQDLDHLADLLRAQEGYDVADGDALSELVRLQAGGERVTSMATQEAEAAADAEKRHRETIRQHAAKHGVKTVGVPFALVEATVLRLLEERHAQAVAKLDARDQKRFEAAVAELSALAPESEIDAILTLVAKETGGMGPRAFWQRATTQLRAYKDAIILERVKDEAQEPESPGGPAAAEAGATGEPGGGRTADRSDQAPAGFQLEQQDTAADQGPAPDLTKEQIDREAAHFGLEMQSQPKPQGVQGNLLSATGQPSAENRPSEQAKNPYAPGPDVATAADWATEMARLRNLKPRPLDKLYGQKGPTPEQATAHAEQMRLWNAAYRKASKNQKELLERENRAFRERQQPKESQNANAPQLEPPTPATQPALARPDEAAKAQAQADLDAALGDLGDLIGKPFRANITPEQEQQLLPVLTRVFDAAFRLGYYKFKDAARFVLQTIRAKLGNGVADALTLDHLQGGYIAMSGRYRDQGADSARAVVGVESLEELENAASEPTEPDTRAPTVAPLQDDTVGAEPRDGQSVPGAGQPQGSAQGGRRVPGARPAPGGERGDQSVHTADGQFRLEDESPRTDEPDTGLDPGAEGLELDAGRDEAIEAAAQSSHVEKLAAQRAAESIAVKPADRANIDQTLPFLNEGQREDVQFAEARWQQPDGYGVLFTNGTGTGKTYLGLGAIKRLVKQGKKNGLVVAPNEAVIAAWVASAPSLGLQLHVLEDTQSPGQGVAITTYANFYQNQALARRDYDFIAIDEAHLLMQSKDAEVTEALAALRALALHPEGARRRAEMLHGDLLAEFHAAEEAAKRARMSDDQREWARIEALESKAATLGKRWQDALDAVKADVAQRQGAARPRVLFLSATPFAYETNIQWGAGFLFDYPAVQRSGYNSPNPYQAFMIQHFGYRMRYNKLTEPDARVDRDLMQRQFNSWMRKQGVLSARMLDVDQDYERKFILINGGVGQKIDEGLTWLREAENGRYAPIYDTINDQFDYLTRARLLEAIKAEAAVGLIKKHHALGRKVVVFYDFNTGGGINVFNVAEQLAAARAAEASPQFHLTAHGVEVPVKGQGKVSYQNLKKEKVSLATLLQEFVSARPDLQAIDFRGYTSPLTTLLKAFPAAGVYNGLSQYKKTRIQAIKDFNDDSKPGANLLLVQKAANAGWSGHDTTGKHPRVLLNLGQPTAPIEAIQQEGRIYRVGQQSDANFQYFNTGTNWERFAFGSKISRRAGTAENLAMGEQARGLREAFIQAFEASDPAYEPSAADGKGGKLGDRALVTATTDFERAKALYFGQQKKTARTKAQEGVDYFATPEPLGLKMVEWADGRFGERWLEPSAGHGAIARWFPEKAERTVVEPSLELASRLTLVTDAKLIQERFENLSLVNKYHAVVMNPPFGVGGKTAIEHLDKAFKHLSPGGRIVALIPEGPMADKRFDDWLQQEHAAEASLVGSLGLPSVTFERAGTTVNARVVIIDKGPAAGNGLRFNFPADTIGEFFDALENLQVPPRRNAENAPAPVVNGRTATDRANAAALEREATWQPTEGEEVVFEQKGNKLLTNAPVVKVTTKAGKELTGVKVPDEKLAKGVDEFTYQPWGRGQGWFVRLRHIERPQVLGSLEDDQSRAVTQAIDRAIALEQGRNVPPLKRESARKRLEVLRRELEAGKRTPEQFVAAVESLHARLEVVAQARKYGPVPERTRGADYIRQRLLEAKRRGDISEEAADLAEWFILQNPALADDLGISVRSPGERNRSAGNYNPLTRVVTLFRGSASDTTAVHEVLHHLERLMPATMQADIRREWARVVAAELKTATGKRAAYLQAALLGDVRQAVKILTGQDLAGFNQPVFHGSPHRFDKFTLDHIGSGEGAQAYGWGLYFAGRREVGEFYREATSRIRTDTQAIISPIIRDRHVTTKERAEIFKSAIGDDPIESAARRLQYRQASLRDVGVGVLTEAVRQVRAAAKGQLYEVEIPDDDQYLLWDKPLSEQPESVAMALVRAAQNELGDDIDRGDSVLRVLARGSETVNGGLAYRAFARSLGSPEAASKYLHSVGIQGIKYLDGTSRAAGEGSYNYVLFDDSAIQILKTYYSLSFADYQYLNASEFWAVRMTSRVADRFAARNNLWQRTVRWLREALERIKGVLGLRSDAPLLKALNAVMKSDGSRQSDQMLSEAGEYNARARPVPANRQPQLGQAPGDLESAKRKAGLGPAPTFGERVRGYFDRVADLVTNQRQEILDMLRQGTADQFYGVLRAERRTLGSLPQEQSAYVAARLATGSASVMRAILLHGQPQWAANGQHLEKKPGTVGLLDVLNPVADDLDDWLGWMVGNRASRLMTEDRENNFTRDEVDALMALGKGREARFIQVANDFAAFKRSILDVAEQAGLIDKTTRPVWDHADWIPFYRVREGDTLGPRGRRGLANQRSGIRMLRGGESALNDPLENVILNFQHLLDASLKNNAVRKAIAFAPDVAERVGMDMSKVLVPVSQIKTMMQEQQVPDAIIKTIPGAVFQGIQKMWAIQVPTDPDVVRVMVDGHAQFFRVTDPLLLRAVTSFQPFDFPGLGVARAFRRVLTASVTATPEFMLRNFLRDTGSTALTSRDTVAFGGALKGAVKAYRESGAAEQMLFAGASFAGGHVVGHDREAIAREVRRALRQHGLSAASMDSFLGTVIDSMATLWGHYRQVGDAIENANREAVYEATRNAGKSPTAAAFEAKDLMDFSLRGGSAAYQLLADVLPFFNARVQGLYRLGRSDPKALIVRGAILLMLPSLLLAFANGGDDRYEELPDWDKDTYWHFFTPFGHFRLPKPFEVGVVFATLPERLERWLAGHDTGKKLLERAVWNIQSQLNLVEWPQFAKPLIENWANRDTFRQRDIETQGDQEKLPHLRYDARTSDTLRELVGTFPAAADWAGMSPKKAQHLVEGYLGVMGAAGLAVLDAGARLAVGTPDRPAMRPEDMVLLRTLYRGQGAPAYSTQFVQDVFDAAREYSQIKRSIAALTKEGNKEKADRYLKEYADRLSLGAPMQKAAENIARLNKQVDFITRDTRLTADQKRQRIDEVLQRRNDIAKQAVAAQRKVLAAH